MHILLGNSYIDPGVTWLNGSLLRIEGSVNTKQPGSYYITYTGVGYTPSDSTELHRVVKVWSENWYKTYTGTDSKFEINKTPKAFFDNFYYHATCLVVLPDITDKFVRPVFVWARRGRVHSDSACVYITDDDNPTSLNFKVRLDIYANDAKSYEVSKEITIDNTQNHKKFMFAVSWRKQSKELTLHVLNVEALKYDFHTIKTGDYFSWRQPYLHTIGFFENETWDAAILKNNIITWKESNVGMKSLKSTPSSPTLAKGEGLSIYRQLGGTLSHVYNLTEPERVLTKDDLKKIIKLPNNFKKILVLKKKPQFS